jgi:hypothetical protein
MGKMEDMAGRSLDARLNSSYLYQGIDGIYKYEDPYDESLAKLL